MTKTLPTTQTQRGVYSRQIAFVAAFLLPTAKFLEIPRILAKYTMGDLLLPALLHALSQLLLLLAVLYAASIPFREGYLRPVRNIRGILSLCRRFAVVGYGKICVRRLF